MVIEPLSLIFFRVPSCRRGTAMARASAARIRVIGRSCRSPCGRSSGRAGWVGEAAGFYGSPPPLVQGAAAAPAGLEFDLCLQKDRDHEPGATRIEHDLLGDRAVPADAYYGIHTLRALENFRIRDGDLHLPGARARARLRQAGGGAREQLASGLLPDDKADCDRADLRGDREGKLLDQFVVDVPSRAGQGPRPT